MQLTFDEKAHRYFLDGVPVPNVTRVLAPLTDYSHIPADRLEIARQKGVAVHKMVELWAKEDLDEDGIPEWMQPVLEQWRKFVDEAGVEIVESEYRVAHPIYRYAGTLDILARLRHAGEVALIDIKRSFLAGGCIGLQTAAYLEAYYAQEKVGKNCRRYALKLNENGPYRLEPYPDKNDFQVFLAALTLHNWKEKQK